MAVYCFRRGKPSRYPVFAKSGLRVSRKAVTPSRAAAVQALAAKAAYPISGASPKRGALRLSDRPVDDGHDFPAQGPAARGDGLDLGREAGCPPARPQAGPRRRQAPGPSRRQPRSANRRNRRGRPPRRAPGRERNRACAPGAACCGTPGPLRATCGTAPPCRRSRGRCPGSPPGTAARSDGAPRCRDTAGPARERPPPVCSSSRCARATAKRVGGTSTLFRNPRSTARGRVR